MDTSNGDSLFNFCNFFNSMQLDKDLNNDKNILASLQANTNNNNNNNNNDNNSANSLQQQLTKKEPNVQTLNKNLKSLLNNVDNHRNDLGSTGASDKSLSSFGSESNDSSCEPSSSSSETLLLSLNDFMNSSANNNNSNQNNNNGIGGGNEQQHVVHHHHHHQQQFRDTLQSPGFLHSYAFPSSNSSSPPLSQTSGPSSASSLQSETVSTNVAFNSFNNNNNNNKLNNSTALASLHGNFCPNTTTTAIQASFSTPLPQSIQKSNPLFSSISKNENLFQNLNSLDNALNSLLSPNKNGINSDSTINEISSLLSTTNPFGTSDSCNVERRQTTQPSPALFSSSQDCLNPIQAANSLSFSDGDPFNLVTNSRKVTPFNNNSLGALSINSKTTSTNLSPTIISNNSLCSNFPIYTDLLDQRQSNNNNNTNSNINSQYSSSLAINSTANIQLQARFDYQIRLITNEINSTVQLYLNSIQMRKEQLMKQLDHVRNAYLLLLNQNFQKNKLITQLPKITFTRPDQNLFKSITSFGFINTPAFAPCCQVTGEGLSIAIEGEPTCFSISTRNCFNEEILVGGENIDIEIQSNETATQHSSFIPTFQIQKNILDNNNGKYNVTYMIPRGSGFRLVKIFISINGLLTNNSPFVATVKTERLRENWKLIALYGEEGSEPGKFCRPWGIAITRLPLQKDPNHKLVGDTNPPNIPIQSKSFYNWTCSNFKKDYLLAVADRSNNRIQLLKLSVTDINNNTNNNNNCHGQFLMKQANKVEISVLHVFGSGPGTRPGLFDRPAGIVINSNLGQLVVADKDNHRIQVFDMIGGFLFKFGEKGSRPGQFCYPWDVAICPQTSMILVSDTRNRRIQLFTHYGKYLWHCGQPLDSPRGVAFLTPERYIISDFNKHRLLIIDKNDSNSHQMTNHRDEIITSKYIGFGEGSAWGEFLRPQGLVAVVKKTAGVVKCVQILCADSRNNRIAIYNSLNQNFEYINEESAKVDVLANVSTTFDRPSGIAIADNILAVIDFGNNRLQIFQKNLS